MDADGRGLKHQELTKKIIGVFYEVYNELGYGYAESVYERALAIALAQAGMDVRRQYPITVYFRSHVVGEFSADMLIDERVIIELKTARTLDSAHESQALNYLRSTPIEIGLRINFGPKPEFKRFAFDNSRKPNLPPLAQNNP